MLDILLIISNFALPAVIILIITAGVLQKVKLFDAFTEGAKDGIKTVLNLLPIMIGLVTAVSVFRASGAMELLCGFLFPLADKMGIPEEVIPLAILKPISGSASAGIAADIIASNGADTFVGRVASVILGATDTMIYTTAIYFGANGIKKTRYAGFTAAAVSCAALAAAIFVLSS